MTHNNVKGFLPERRIPFSIYEGDTMNENEIPNHDFDKVLAFFEAIIGKHRKNPTQPKNGCLYRIKLLTSIIDQLEQIRSDSEKKLSNVKSDCPIILPVHHGYTVDFMLRQFRKALGQNTGIHTIRFGER